MRNAESRVHDTGVFERLSVAELLEKISCRSERRYLVSISDIMLALATPCAQEIEEAQTEVEAEMAAPVPVVDVDVEMAAPVVDVVKQMLDQEVNARMEEWFSEAAKDIEPK